MTHKTVEKTMDKIRETLTAWASFVKSFFLEGGVNADDDTEKELQEALQQYDELLAYVQLIETYCPIPYYERVCEPRRPKWLPEIEHDTESRLQTNEKE